MTKALPTEILGNQVIDGHLERDFPVFLMKITNQDWDECGKFAVVTDCGWNPLEGWREFDYRYFDTLGAAYSAFDKEVRGLELTSFWALTNQPENTRFNALSLPEVELLLDLVSGRAEDLDCDGQVIPGDLENLVDELTREHLARTNG